MSNLLDALNKKISSLGISRQVEAVGVVEASQREIARFISSKDFEVISFSEGVLKIKTLSSSAAAQIKNSIPSKFLKENKIIRLSFRS